MIQLFKTNSPSLYSYLLLYLLVLTAVHFVHPMPYHGDIEAPLSQLIFDFLHLIPLSPSYTETIISIILLFMNALLINELIFRYKIFNLTCQLPGLIYILIACSFESWSHLSPAMMTNTLFILLLNRILGLGREQIALVSVFDIGLYVGIGSLLYFPFIVHLITLYIGVTLLRPFVLREWLAGLAGVLTPYFLAGTYYYWQGSFIQFFNGHLIEPIRNGLPTPVFTPYFTIWAGGSLLVMIFLIALVNLQRLFLKSTIQLRKSYTLILWALLFTSASLLLNETLRFAHFSSIAVPLAFIATHFFMTIEQKKTVETVHTVLFVTFIILQYMQFLIPNIPFL